MRAIILADALRGLRGRDRGASLFPSNPFDRVAHLYATQGSIAAPAAFYSARPRSVGGELEARL